MTKILSIVQPLPRRVVSMNPEEFSDEFDLATEVTVNKDQLVGDAILQLTCPEVVLFSLALERERAAERYQDKTISKLAKGASSAACIRCGLELLFDTQEVKEYLLVAQRVKDLRSLSRRARYDLHKYMHKWKFLPHIPHDGTGKLQIRCSEQVRALLAGRSEEIGLTMSSLGAVALMAGLSTQPEVEYLEDMERAVQDFIKEIVERTAQVEFTLKAWE